jgi:hypothetical protein
MKNKELNQEKSEFIKCCDKLKQVINALPQLQSEIRKIAGIELKLTASLNKNEFDNYRIYIKSDDFSKQLKGFASTFFKAVYFDTQGGFIVEKAILIKFFPQVNYKHFGGGSNGIDYIYTMIWFNIETGKFIFEDEMRIYKI